MSVYMVVVVHPDEGHYKDEFFLQSYNWRYRSTSAITDEDLPEVLRKLVNHPGAIDPNFYGYIASENILDDEHGWEKRAYKLGRVGCYLKNNARVVLLELGVDPKAIEELPDISKDGFSNFIKKNIKEIRTFDDTEGFFVESGKIEEIFPIKLDHEQVFRIDTQEAKQPIIDALAAYIRRIDKYEDGFQHGFWFFKESRAANRAANYLLAQQMLHELEKPDASISNIFCNLEAKHKVMFEEWKLKGASRGINSSELKDIIELARQQVEMSKTPKPA